MRRRGASRRRTLKKPRKAKISDVDTPVVEDKASKVMTSTADEGHLHMKEKLEVIRNQLGPSWLKSLEIHQSSGETNGERPTTETRDNVIVRRNETSATSQVSTSPVDDTDTIIPTRSSPKVAVEMTNGGTLTEERNSSSSRRQSDALDWKWQMPRAESVDYGVESEPFIASLADAPADQFLLTVTERYVLEKDLDGEVTEVLDLQCLRGLRFLGVEGGDSEVVHLVFDYVRKDRQERRYLLEDSGDVKKFCQLLQPMLEDGQMADKMKDRYECMKCGATFNESRAEHTFQTSTRNSAIGELEDVLLCPACSSALIVQLDDHQVAPGWQRTMSTPIGRFGSPAGNSPRVSSAINSSLRKSLFITDSECSVTVATDASTSYQSCQTALSSSFQSLPNSPSPRGGFIAHSYPDSARGKLNNNVPAQTGATKTSNVIQSTEGYDAGTMTMDTDRVAHSRSDNGSSETVKYDDSSEGSFSRNGVVVGDIASRTDHACITARDSDTFQPGQRHSLDLSCATDDSDILVLRNNLSAISLGGASLAGNSVVANSETDSDIAVLQCPGGDHGGETLTGSPRTSAIDCQLSQVLLNRINVDGSSSYGRSHDPSPSGSLTDKAVNSMVTSMYEKSLYESDGSLCDTTSSDGEAGGFSTRKPPVLRDTTSLASSGDVFRYFYDDYSQVDHRLKLHLAMKLFAADEEFQLLLRCGIVLPKKAEFPALLVISSSRLYVLRIAGKQSVEQPEKWLKVAQQQTLARIRSIQLGLGAQLFRLDVGYDCLTALLRDEARCHRFIGQFTAVLYESVFYGTRHPPEVTRDNPCELADLTQNVLLHQESSGAIDVDDIDTTLLKFVMCHLHTTVAGETRRVPVSLIVTPSHICLAIDDAACRVAAPADGATKKSGPQKAQFTFKARQKLLDLTSIDLYKTIPTEAALRFVDECSQEETVWRVAMETKPSLLSLVSSISQPWETEFGVDLQVNVCIEPEQS